MTNHPLTDELLQQIGCENPRARVFDNQAMRAAYDKGRIDMLEEIFDAWCDALQEESECGIKSLSENRAADMKRDYPVLTSFGVVLDAMRPAQEDQEDQEDLNLAMERKRTNGPTTRLTLEELSMRPKQEDN